LTTAGENPITLNPCAREYGVVFHKYSAENYACLRWKSVAINGTRMAAGVKHLETSAS
jgi:hypothetical protein